LATCCFLLLAAMLTTCHGAIVTRRPVQRETALATPAAPAAVIVVPDEPEYRALGRQLAAAIAGKTGIRLPVESAADYVSRRPCVIKPERLDRPFIVLGQFWNNAVLERLYAGHFDPTDAVFPGPGGWELRTVCSPFRAGQNCVVATGSDLDGCRKAVAALPALFEGAGSQSRIPFLQQVHLAGEAAQLEAAYRQRMAPILAELDRYAVFGHPQGKVWADQNPNDFLTWNDRNLATAAVFGLRFWTTGDRRDAAAFKRLVFGCREHLDRLTQSYREGRGDLMDYSGGELTIAWDLIQHSDAFSDADRDAVTDYLFQLADLNRRAYYAYHCKDIPLADVKFHNRHQIAGTLWLGREADYLARNCLLSPAQQLLADQWRGDAERYLQRLVQSPFYSDGVQLINDEGGLVLRYALMTGKLDFADNGSLRLLADYFVVNHDNLGELMSSGHGGGTRCGAEGGEILNAAGWLFPNEGYQWFRQRLGRSAYRPFLWYVAGYFGLGFPYFNYDLPPRDDGSAKLTRRMEGIEVLPMGEAFAGYLQRYPQIAEGGYQRLPGRYHYAPSPAAPSWKRIALRTGFAPADQYLALDGLQGLEWSDDDINAIVRYDDLGEPLLKSKWDARDVESRLEMNTLLVSNGTPGAKQSVAARLAATADLGPEALLGSLAAEHDGVAWTRNVLWRKNAWFLVADEVRAPNAGDHFLAQTWLSWHPFELHGAEATAQAKDVTLHVVGTPERQFSLARGTAGPEGVRQQVSATLVKDRPFVLWTLLYASSPQRRAHWSMHHVAGNAVLLTGDNGSPAPQPTLAFLGAIDQGGLRVSAQRGLISTERITLAGCRELSVAGRPLLSSDVGMTLAWDLNANRFEAGKRGYGLTAGENPPGLEKQHAAVVQAVKRCLAAAAARPAFAPPGVPGVAASNSGLTPLPIAARYQLRTPVSLACADLKGNGNDELLLYDDSGKPRFDCPSFRAEPIALRFDKGRSPDIAFSLDNAVAVYHSDGTLRWREALGGTANAMSAGDLDGDGREELGLCLRNYAVVLDHSQRRLIDEEVYRYNGLAGGFADVDGDGRKEFVAVTCSGVNVLKPGQPRRTSFFQSCFGLAPCRLWLGDLDGDGLQKGYLGGAGSDLACYDLKKVSRKWTFAAAPVHPADAALVDIDGDGQPEIISGGGDGFLYVVEARDGKFRFSRSMGAAITALAAVPVMKTGTGSATGGAVTEAERPSIAVPVPVFIVGLETGKVLLVGRGLKPLGSAELGAPVEHLAVLRRAGRGPSILAADNHGRAIRVNLEVR
jgi:hypothetical protein